MDGNKKQIATIILPGEKTISQAIEEAKALEQERKNEADRSKNYYLGSPIYLLFKYSVYDIPFWWQE